MRRTRAISIVTLAAALGAPGCRTTGDGDADDLFGAVLGTAAVVMVESFDDDDRHDEHKHEHRCRRRR